VKPGDSRNKSSNGKVQITDKSICIKKKSAKGTEEKTFPGRQTKKESKGGKSQDFWKKESKRKGTPRVCGNGREKPPNCQREVPAV